MISTSTPKRIKPEPSVKRITIDPQKAMDLLEIGNTNNRKVSEKYVKRLARDIVDGKWKLTHAGIAFGPDGTLLDGQHRLWAVIEAGMPVEMYVWLNVDPDSMMAIDCGKTRSMADILNIAGENGEVTNYRLATLRAMLGGFGNPPVLSPAETSQALIRHHEAISFALDQLPRVSSARNISTAATRAVIARAFYSVDTTMLKDFCRKLSTGIVTADNESLLVTLRQYLQSQRGSSYSERMQRYGKVQRALAAWLKGSNPSRLCAATSELFPLSEEAKV